MEAASTFVTSKFLNTRLYDRTTQKTAILTTMRTKDLFLHFFHFGSYYPHLTLTSAVNKLPLTCWHPNDFPRCKFCHVTVIENPELSLYELCNTPVAITNIMHLSCPCCGVRNALFHSVKTKPPIYIMINLCPISVSNGTEIVSWNLLVTIVVANMLNTVQIHNFNIIDADFEISLMWQEFALHHVEQ